MLLFLANNIILYINYSYILLSCIYNIYTNIPYRSLGTKMAVLGLDGYDSWDIVEFDWFDW